MPSRAPTAIAAWLSGVPLLPDAPRIVAAEGMGRDRRFRAPRPVRAAAHADRLCASCRRLLWPLFGLSVGGLVLATVLTTVVALHELGHMAAFRMMGHRNVRMIFIPLLGGIAIGGRPYDRCFEVAFVALMGAGFSAFLIPLAIASSDLAHGAGYPAVAVVFAALPVLPRSSTSPISCRSGNSTAARCCGRFSPGS